MFGSLILVGLKYVGIFLALVIAYSVIFLVIPPLRKWLFYRKFKNIHTSPMFIPILGDFLSYAQNMKANKKYYAHLHEKTLVLKDYDLELIFEGPKSCIQMVSPEAHRQFEALSPEKIDRVPEDTSIGQMMPRTLGNSKTDDSFIFRKRTFLKLLSFNRSSQYIPMMIKGLDKLTNEWVNSEKEVDVIYEMFKQNFRVLTSILLGRDTKSVMDKLRPYKKPDNAYVMMDLCDFFMKTTDTYIDQYLNPITLFLPFLNKKNLIDPFKRNNENNEMLRKTLQEAIDFSKDETSVLYNMRETMGHDPVQMLDDLMGVMMAGVDTSAHVFCTTLWLLKKNPDKLKILLEELDKHGLNKDCNMDEKLTKEAIEEIDYLGYVIKEALRCDSPTIDTLNYEAKEDISICDVPISKGQYIKLNLFSSNHNVNEHQRPFDFIPERFDPESKFFTKPGPGNKSPSPFAHIPFSHGQRGCPGQSLAMLQLKVDIVYVLAKYDFELEQKILNNDMVGFALRSGFDMMVKFTRR